MKKKILIIVAVCLILGLTALYLFHPGRKYKKAVAAFENGSYEDAMTGFSAVSEYRDSQQYISYLTYLKQYENGEYEAAETGFESLGSFRDSSVLAAECVRRQQVLSYEKAQGLLTAQNYGEAASIFSMLGDYAEAPDYTVYCKAMEAFSDGRYHDAHEMFLTIPKFLDASGWAAASLEMEQETFYRAAMEAFEAEAYEQARSLFQRAAGYEDAALYINYLDGLLAFNEEKYTAAATAFGSVSGFRDAAEMARLSTERQLSVQYQSAVRLFKAGNYDEALPAFDSISGYADSEDYIHYMNAMNALSEERYPEAIKELRELGTFLDSKSQADQAEEQYHSTLYNAALAAFEDENDEDALHLFTELGEYRDAASYAAYTSGRLAVQRKDYLEANIYFESVPDFLDSAEQAVSAHAAYNEQQYTLARSLFDDGDLAGAREGFLRAENYLDAASYVPYIDGKNALLTEDYWTAEKSFAGLGDFLDSRELAAYSTEQLKPIRYEMALSALDAGSYETALSGFEQLPGYLEADQYAAYTRVLQTAYVGDYLDAIEMVKSLNGFLDSELLAVYFKARQAEADQRYEDALELYGTIDSFRDSSIRTERLPDMILDRDFDAIAERLTERKWWNQALENEVSSMLVRKYRLSNTTMPLRFISLADTMLEAGDFEHSYRLIQLVAQQDERATSKLDDIQYLYALTAMEAHQPEQAEWMLSELADAGYPGAEETLETCLEMLEAEARENGDEERAESYRRRLEMKKDDGEKNAEGLLVIDPALYNIPGADIVREEYHLLRDKLRTIINEAGKTADNGMTPDIYIAGENEEHKDNSGSAVTEKSISSRAESAGENQISPDASAETENEPASEAD